MFGGKQILDKDLIKTVNQRLARAGSSSRTRISAVVQSGAVTLTGTLQYAAQRSPLVKAVSSIAGVRRVMDLMEVVARKREQLEARPQAAAASGAPTAAVPWLDAEAAEELAAEMETDDATPSAAADGAPRADATPEV